MSADRRKFIKATAMAGAAAFAGCIGDDDDDEDLGTVERIGPEDDTDEEYEEVDEFEWMGWTRGEDLEFFLTQRTFGDQLEGMGFDFAHRPLALGPIVDGLIERNFQFYNSAFFGTFERSDPVWPMSSYTTDNLRDGINYTEYPNPEYDEAYEDYITEVEPDERREKCREVDRIINRDKPAVYTHSVDILSATNDNHFTGWLGAAYEFPYFTFENFSNLEPQGGQTDIVYAETREPNEIQYMSMTDGQPNIQLNRLYHDHLTAATSDGDIEPWAATDWDIVDDLTIDFTIRDDMYFHDGEPVTVDDVAFTFEYLLEWDVPYVLTAYQAVESAEVLSDDEVRINFEEPDGAFINTALPQLPVLPMHIWDGVVDEENLDHPGDWDHEDSWISSGPFEMTAVERDSHITLEVFDDHHSADFDFERFIWNIYGESATAIGALEADEASFIHELDPSEFQRLDREVDHISAREVPSYSSMHILCAAGASPEWGKEPKCLIDPAFHHAMAWYLDKDALVQLVLRGFGHPISSMLTPEHPWDNSDNLHTDPDHDIDKALQILIDAGYRWNDDGDLLMPMNRLSEIEEEQLDLEYDPTDWIPDSAN